MYSVGANRFLEVAYLVSSCHGNRITLKISGPILVRPGLDKDSFSASIKVMTAFWQKELEKKAADTAKNELESYILKTQEYLNIDEDIQQVGGKRFLLNLFVLMYSMSAPLSHGYRNLCLFSKFNAHSSDFENMQDSTSFDFCLI